MMIESNKNCKFSFDFSDDTMNDIKFYSKILNISICQDNSSAVISSENNLFSIYSFQELLTLRQKKSPFKIKYNKILPEIEELIKYINKNNKVPSRPIFELNPYYEEGTSMAIGINKTVMIAVFSKKDSLYEIEHWEKCDCIFIQWEQDDYDLLICAFENRKIKIIKNCDVLYDLQDEDDITAMKSVHYQKYKLLITGYNKKVKIRNFESIIISNNEFKPYSIPNINGTIDIIEYKTPYILFCSKKNKVVYCFVFNGNNWRPEKLFEINRFNGLKEEQQIINVKFITNEGIIVAFTNKIYMYYIKNNKDELVNVIQVMDHIIFTSVIFCRTQYYFLCAFKTKIRIININIEEKNHLLECPENNPEDNKEIINTTINTLLNRKNEFKIRKIEDYVIQFEIDDVIIKMEFNIKDLSAFMSIVKCDDHKLRGIIEDELDKFNRNNEDTKYNAHFDSSTDTLKRLNEIIKSNIGDSLSEENSEINKVKKESFLECYRFLKNWKEITKKKTPVNNLFKEEEEFDSYNKLMFSSIKDLINWDFSYDNLNVDTAFNYVNNNTNDLSSPSIFQFGRDETNENPFSSTFRNRKNRKQRKKSTSTSEVLTFKEDTQKLNESFELIKCNEKIDEINEVKKGVSYKLTKETFGDFIDKINKKINDGDIKCLVEILGQIKFYIQEIINQRSNNLINLYVLNILDIITLLESQLNLDFLFICILPISFIIYSEITKEMKRKEPIFTKSKLTNSLENRVSVENELKQKNYSGLLSSSESNDELNDGNDNNSSDFILNAEETNNNSLNNDNYNNYINESKTDNKAFDSSKESNVFLSKNYSKNSVELTKSLKKWNVYRNMSFLSVSNKNDKNFIELFGANFCNIIIDYVIFFSKELQMLDSDLSHDNLIDFFILAIKIYETPEITNEINDIIKKTI